MNEQLIESSDPLPLPDGSIAGSIRAGSISCCSSVRKPAEHCESWEVAQAVHQPPARGGGRMCGQRLLRKGVAVYRLKPEQLLFKREV